MLIASAIIDGRDPIWRRSIVAGYAAGDVAAIKKAINLKVDFAKVYSLLSREA